MLTQEQIDEMKTTPGEVHRAWVTWQVYESKDRGYEPDVAEQLKQNYLRLKKELDGSEN